jgi:hypothetical protein
VLTPDPIEYLNDIARPAAKAHRKVVAAAVASVAPIPGEMSDPDAAAALSLPRP